MKFIGHIHDYDIKIALFFKYKFCWAYSYCEEKHIKDYFQINISHQECLFKIPYLICRISHQEGCNYYSIGI